MYLRTYDVCMYVGMYVSWKMMARREVGRFKKVSECFRNAGPHLKIRCSVTITKYDM